MAYGVQAYHEVDPLNVLALSQRLGTAFPVPSRGDDEYDWSENHLEDFFAAVDPILAEVHDALIRVEFDNVRLEDRLGGRYKYLTADTPAGPRSFVPFSLRCVGDTGEMDEKFPDDFIWGINIATRYFPTWIDWREEAGVYQYRHDERMYRMAVEAIGAEFPELADGSVAVRLEHF